MKRETLYRFGAQHSVKNNMEVWERMGKELMLLDRFALDILCDETYQSMMDKKNWGNILRPIVDKIGILRSRAENRMGQVTGQFDSDIFYGTSREDISEALRIVRGIFSQHGEAQKPENSTICTLYIVDLEQGG